MYLLRPVYAWFTEGFDAGKRAITPDTDLRLCWCFGLSDGSWLRRRDTEILKAPLAGILDQIKPWTESVKGKASAH